MSKIKKVYFCPKCRCETFECTGGVFEFEDGRVRFLEDGYICINCNFETDHYTELCSRKVKNKK